MELNIIKKFGKDYLQFDNVEEIVFKNFGGDGNGRGDIKGEFGIKLNNYPEIVERLQESKNKFGIPWNVKTWVPKDDSEPVTYLTGSIYFKEFETGNTVLSTSISKTIHKVNDATIVSFLDPITYAY